MKKLKNDPENYRKMSQPHENEEAAKKALDGFYEQVSEARKKFGIADVLIVVKDSIMHDDGREGVFFSQCPIWRTGQRSSYGSLCLWHIESRRKRDHIKNAIRKSIIR